MSDSVDVAVVGAGPAGLAAAACTARAGLDTVLIDEQPTAGGQIYRALGAADERVRAIAGPDYGQGRELLDALGESSVRHLSATTVWQISPEREIFFSRDGRADTIAARSIILATGAMERPMPFPGWTKAGVMTAGAAQILLKSSGLIPREPVVLAGSGPLLYLLAWQYLRAGAAIGAIVETTPTAQWLQGLRHLPGALRAHHYLRKGFTLLREIRRNGVAHYRAATGLEARGNGPIDSLRFRCGARDREIPCTLLLLHQGVVPNVQITRSLGIEHDWNELQRCWHPRKGAFGETVIEGIYVAGDGGGIGGAQAAEHQGRLAGFHAARQLDALNGEAFESHVRGERRALAHELAIRPFLDALYAPAPELLSPADETVVCRCEEVTAGAVREYVRLGCLGPNQTKAFGRPGMGPCQGRMCGLTVSEIIAGARGVPPAEVGYYRVRPPIKPVTLGELAAIPIDE